MQRVKNQTVLLSRVGPDRPVVLVICILLGTLLGTLFPLWGDGGGGNSSPNLAASGVRKRSHPSGSVEIMEETISVTVPKATEQEIPVLTKNVKESKVRDPRLTHLLELELQFESTLKSCLSSYCFDEPVLVDGKKANRIGFLAPPFSGSETLIAMLNKAARKDLIATGTIENSTHVPAYGYGKNHGWTRIVRLVRRVVPHALSTLNSAGATTTTTTTTTTSTELFDLQIRQLVRWQCRLSHVAAHTKMLTVFMDDVILRPVIELDKILSFVGIRAARSDLVEASNAFGRQLQADLDMHGVDYNPTSHAVIEHLDILPQNLIEPALASLESEMTTTDTLAKWPCKSFRELEKKLPNLSLSLPIPAKELAADCGSPKVVCSVPYDQRGG